MTDRPGHWWRRRVGRFTAYWPTCLPGVRFLARGTLTHLVVPQVAGTHRATAARAAARLALDELGRGIAGKHRPEELECARQKLALAISPWHNPTGRPGLWLRARLVLLLPQQDADRSQRHQDALRDVELRLAQERLRRQELARTVCADQNTARLWWLEQHLDDLSALDWTSFQEAILPVVGTSATESTEAERLAHTLLYVWKRLDAMPGRQARFMATARTLFEQMGWADGFPWPPPDDLEPATPSPTAVPLPTEDEQ
ncbi:hypothetical protein EDD96_1296 [Streptomyces sp. Ag109_G2-6]|uniref:hypothetical protein n=1 Tax=Streptomyces TaxID=1883 RepID=UPI0009A4D75F|nr:MULTISPECIES: hypothetical protein [Streptomyces]RPF44758.1 hypothetical protein EDD96_1296 [Streptomyces sp. Ag109_G2-6]